MARKTVGPDVALPGAAREAGGMFSRDAKRSSVAALRSGLKHPPGIIPPPPPARGRKWGRRPPPRVARGRLGSGDPRALPGRLHQAGRSLTFLPARARFSLT